MDEDTIKIIELRHELHEHPELSMNEVRTKAKLMDFMKDNTGLKVVDKGHWFYAVYETSEDTNPIAFRADFDALPIRENSGKEYASKTEGISHACGHDGHSAVLCALALWITKHKPKRTIYLIFQHAEEIGEGAKECCSLIKEARIKRIYGFHNWSGFPLGSLVIRSGCTHCASKGLTISFAGVSAHASQPEDGINPSEAIAKLLLDIVKIEGNIRETYNSKLTMATIVNVSVGSKNFGIAASNGEISMTLRRDKDEWLELLEEEIMESAKALANEYKLGMKTSVSDEFLDVENDITAVNEVIAAFQASSSDNRLSQEIIILDEPIRSSEDFGYYLKECTGAFFYIGNGENYPQIHTTEYDFNDRIIKTAVEVFAQLIEKKCI